jgi:hypothetical protein
MSSVLSGSATLSPSFVLLRGFPSRRLNLVTVMLRLPACPQKLVSRQQLVLPRPDVQIG